MGKGYRDRKEEANKQEEKMQTQVKQYDKWRD